MGKNDNVFGHVEHYKNLKNNHPDWVPIAKPEPTKVMPGTDDKVMVFARRLERGEDLFADGDLYCDAVHSDVVTRLVAMGDVGEE